MTRPTGPRADRRRSRPFDPLHRVSGGRITPREPPKGPRRGRGGMYNNPRGTGPGGRMGGPGAGVGPVMPLNPQQQMQMMHMLEEQARMMAQFMPGLIQPAINPAFQNQGLSQQQRSLFARAGRGGGDRRFDQRRPQHDGNGNSGGGMDVDEADPTTTVCKFNRRCTKTDCPFAHQSPVAPDGTVVDTSDTCPFGAACKNTKCVGRHPSPAQKASHQSEEPCRFFPHCTNPTCPFKHPAMPLCRNGADCSVPGCQFTHLTTACKFHPCLNRMCPYKHVEGQRGVFGDKVWKAPGTHVSERRFVTDEDGPEELIKPGSTERERSHEIIT